MKLFDRLDALPVLSAEERQLLESVEGLARVSRAWRGKPILSTEQIEDIVAYLKTLRE